MFKDVPNKKQQSSALALETAQADSETARRRAAGAYEPPAGQDAAGRCS